MKHTLTVFFAFALCGYFSVVLAAAPDIGQEATLLNQQSKTHLGVSIRALGLLFSAQPSVYALKYGLIRDGSWPFLQELQHAGLIDITTVTGLPNGGAPTSEFVILKLTSKGQQIRNALEH
jgi:hypothetical protein